MKSIQLQLFTFASLCFVCQGNAVPTQQQKWEGFSDDQIQLIKKSVRDYNEKDRQPALPKELRWLETQCKLYESELCQLLHDYLVNLPYKTISRLAEALGKAGVGNQLGELSLLSSQKRAAELVNLLEDILHAGKLDEFQAHVDEELAQAFDHESLKVKVGEREVQIDRVGSSIFLENDIFVAEIPNWEPTMGLIAYSGYPEWLTEEILKLLERLLQTNIDYWPVSYDSGALSRIVAVPFKINSDLSSEKEQDVAEALARMCLETAVPLPDWMQHESFTRDLITGLTAYALKQGTSDCASLIDHINDSVGTNMGTEFLINLCPRTTQVSYIHFKRHDSKCSSPIGMNPSGPNNVNVADWCQVGSLMHETLHSLGFYHQQSRNDRDNWIDVNWENILDDAEHNYNKKDFLVGDTRYDYFSILHYSRINGFSIAGQPTMDATPPRRGGISDVVYAIMVAFYNGAMGQREGLSATDLTALHNVY